MLHIKMYSVFSILQHYHFQGRTVNISSKKMKATLTFARDTKNIKKPTYLKNGGFLIYAPKKIKLHIKILQFERNNRNHSYVTRKLLRILHFKIQIR